MNDIFCKYIVPQYNQKKKSNSEVDSVFIYFSYRPAIYVKNIYTSSSNFPKHSCNCVLAKNLIHKKYENSF